VSEQRLHSNSPLSQYFSLFEKTDIDVATYQDSLGIFSEQNMTEKQKVFLYAIKWKIRKNATKAIKEYNLRPCSIGLITKMFELEVMCKRAKDPIAAQTALYFAARAYIDIKNYRAAKRLFLSIIHELNTHPIYQQNTKLYQNMNCLRREIEKICLQIKSRDREEYKHAL